MRYKPLQSVYAQLLAGAMAAIAGLGILSYVSFSAAVEKQSLQNLRARAAGLAEHTAFLAAPLIAFESKNELARALQALTADPDFAYALVTNEEDQPLASIRAAKPSHLSRAVRTETSVAGGLVHVTTPVVDGGKTWGYFRMGLSLRNAEAEARQIRLQALITTVLLGSAAMLALGWLIVCKISRPLRRLQRATGLLRSGSFPPPLETHSRDEIAILTKEFNRMVAELQEGHLQKQLIEDLEKSTVKAQEASRLKSEFLANMSHEIRTPLNGILGMATLLLDTPLGPDQRESAQTIRSSGDCLLTIINDILDFSKIEAGKLRIERFPFDMQLAAEEVMELVGQRAAAKGLPLLLRYAPETPRRLVGDGGRVRQILLNLVGNAVKFTQEGHVLIEIEELDETTEGALVRVSVHDTGIGIPQPVQKQLFEKFIQADTSTTRKFGGTGLGLAISRQLAELMGGQLDFESTPGKGSTFCLTLRLPLAEDNEPVRWPRQPTGLRVLLADSHEPSLRVLAEQIASWGLRYAAATSGGEALQILRAAAAAKDPFQIAILDHGLPDVEVEQMVQSIRRDPWLGEVRLVLMSWARGAEGLQQNGFHALLTRPVRPSLLHDLLVTLWEGPSQAAARDGTEVPAAIPPPMRNLRVLVVEDNAVNQRVACRMLEKQGCQVDLAGNGKEAVAMVEKFPYDVVFMDCQMPEMDGYEATTEIRRLQEGTGVCTPIVAMTANAMQGDRERCLAAGMDDYISKPVDLVCLNRALAHWASGGSAGEPQSRIPCVIT